MTPRFAARLATRGVVRVSGQDSLRFLQGLVTNDVHEICGPDAPSASAAAFLNGRGRLLFGTLMHRAEDNHYLIDLEASRVSAFIKHLTQYRLRAKVDVDDVSEDHSVWSIVGAEAEDDVELQAGSHGAVFNDPRLSALGKRAILNCSFKGFENMRSADEDAYNRLRILHGVPDGTDFHNTPLPLDLAFHLLNGVSFSKGCYLGQELTARSHFTGVLRKRITPIVVTQDVALATSSDGAIDTDALVSSDSALALAAGTELFVEGKKKASGVVSSSVDNLGLAVLRLNDVFAEEEEGVAVGRVTLGDGRIARAWKPAWWHERAADAVRASD